MKVLVTGADGWCGRFIVPALRDAGYEILEGGLYTDLIREAEFIIHLGARTLGTAHDMVRNITHMELVVNYAQPSIPIINFSSMSIYGIPTKYVDRWTPIAPATPFDLSKAMIEVLLDSRENAISLRLPAIVGPNAHYNWLARLRKGEISSYYNPDAPYNNVVHIDDLCRYIVELTKMDWPVTDYHVKFPLASGGLPSIKTIVELVNPSVYCIGDYQPNFVIYDNYARDVWNWRSMTTTQAIMKFCEENPI